MRRMIRVLGVPRVCVEESIAELDLVIFRYREARGAALMAKYLKVVEVVGAYSLYVEYLGT